MNIAQTPEQPAAPSDATILIVDDVLANRQVLSSLLRKVGYQVFSASNAHQALVQVNLQVPDLILLDIMMPGIDGYTLARRLLSDPKTQKTPIIFISALSEGQEKLKAFELGGADYVTKPFHAEEVLARVAHQIKIARLQRALEQEKAELQRMNQELLQSQRQTAHVFSALSHRLPGSVLAGKYRIEEQLGSGGYGVVYRAMHLGLERPVAVKVFRPMGRAGPEALARFQMEGISACRVNHPNAVAVLDTGMTPEGIAYLVMELLNGPTLYMELKRKGRLSEQRCVEILVPLCDVLIAAHAADIVHRDIKPDNILLHRTADGERVKVLDFGIAKLLGEQPQNARPAITNAQEVLGTSTYIAPERFTSADHDVRSDVYSVGVMLYEMLCGEVPFADSQKTAVQVMFNHLHRQPIPMHTYRSDLSAEMEVLVMQTLTKEPSQRPTAQQLRVALLQLSGPHGRLPQGPHTSSPPSSAPPASGPDDAGAQTQPLPAGHSRVIWAELPEQSAEIQPLAATEEGLPKAR